MRKTFSDLTNKYSKYHFFYVGYLSNWFISTFVDLETGVVYNCVEQYMMHQKALLFGDDDAAKKIMLTKAPSEQKALGRRVSNFDASKWEAVARSIVYRGCYYKFTQSKDLRRKLMSTRETLLVEASAMDKIWGIGMRATDFGVDDPRNWKGRNWLGQVLTYVREDLSKVG